ncbi:pleckstrin homology domain-containing family S member 1-like isoform X2 [Myxocyprinus asiaticus]|uniref:pleckstrin homology domain-containing family S member 1-like isoform X2 n=1 Tax=Myxocyprinus asiaticus TaxID=70543 RepID=UPI002221EDE7|nr:pleckstrin homology domain-containing family S member 1-like isoform X2 [Myxocyprinus asiaticus]
MFRSKSTPTAFTMNQQRLRSFTLVSCTSPLKSWKRRFFVLSKMAENTYQLAYFKNHERRDKCGEIDLSEISYLCTGPQNHHMWDWIQRNFKCPPSSVLFLRVEDIVSKYARDYFLIGENRDEVDGLCSALVKVLKTEKLQYNLRVPEDILQSQSRFRSKSAPTISSESNFQDCDRKSVTDLCPYWPQVRQSAPPCLCTSVPLKDAHYYYPCKFSVDAMPASFKIQESDDEDEDEDNSEYMPMSSVQFVYQQSQEEEDIACFQTKDREIYAAPVDILMDCVTKTQSEDTENLRTHQMSSTDFEEQKTPEQRSNMMNYSTIQNILFSSTSSSHDLCSAAVNQDKNNKSECETHIPVEKEICISQNDLKNSLIFTQEEGKPRVSECRQIENSCPFHKGDQILAFNDLLIDTVEEIHTYLKRLSKDEVKLTVLRHPGSLPLNSEPCLSQ